VYVWFGFSYAWPATCATSAPSPLGLVCNLAASELAAHTEALFGPQLEGRTVRIMVMMPGEAAEDYLLVHDLVAAGMDCMRINCAHDDAATWGG
jgi:hypothetical protein